MKKVFFVFLLSSVACTQNDPKVVSVDLVSKVPPPPSSSEIDEKGNEVFIAVEQNPEFPGGDKAIIEYLSRSIVYPETAQRANVSGRVTVQFIVEKDGSISETKILKGIGFGCDEEAVRVIKEMPNWKPGIQNGKPVRVYFNMPIVFSLNE